MQRGEEQAHHLFKEADSSPYNLCSGPPHTVKLMGRPILELRHGAHP